MTSNIGQQRGIPKAPYNHDPGHVHLILPDDFSELERNEMFKDATTAYNAGDAYLQEALASSDNRNAIVLADASASCFARAAEMAAPPTGLNLDFAQALIIDFEPQRTRHLDRIGIGREPLDAAINTPFDCAADPGSVSLTVQAFQILVRYIITGRNEDFDEAVAIWTRQAQHLKSSDGSYGGHMLVFVLNYLTTAYLQKCVRYERSDEAVKRALELAQEAQEVIQAEMRAGEQVEDYGDGIDGGDGGELDKDELKKEDSDKKLSLQEEHGSDAGEDMDAEDMDEEEPDDGQELSLLFETSVLLAIAHEQSFLQHATGEEMKEAIATIKPFVHHAGLSSNDQARAQYEFGRLTARHALSFNNSDVLHEGIYNVQRATESTPKGSPHWERRQEVFQDLLEAFLPNMPGVGLNALIRSATAQVAAARAMKKPDISLLLSRLSGLHDRRYQLRHTIDDHHDAVAYMKEAAEFRRWVSK